MKSSSLKKKLSFSQALRRLRAINRQFEEGEMDLEKGMAKLKEGLELARFLKKKLTQMENEIKEIKEEFEEA